MLSPRRSERGIPNDLVTWPGYGFDVAPDRTETAVLECRPWPSPGVTPARFDFEALVWEHDDSPGAWHFLRVPAELADEIGERLGCSAAGSGGWAPSCRRSAATFRSTCYPPTWSGPLRRRQLTRPTRVPIAALSARAGVEPTLRGLDNVSSVIRGTQNEPKSTRDAAGWVRRSTQGRVAASEAQG